MHLDGDNSFLFFLCWKYLFETCKKTCWYLVIINKKNALMFWQNKKGNLGLSGGQRASIIYKIEHACRESQNTYSCIKILIFHNLEQINLTFKEQKFGSI